MGKETEDFEEYLVKCDKEAIFRYSYEVTLEMLLDEFAKRISTYERDTAPDFIKCLYNYLIYKDVEEAEDGDFFENDFFLFRHIPHKYLKLIQFKGTMIANRIIDNSGIFEGMLDDVVEIFIPQIRFKDLDYDFCNKCPDKLSCELKGGANG